MSANLVRNVASSTRRVAAADHGDVVVPEEEAVAGGAGRQAVADEALLLGARPSISDWAPVETMTDWAR